MKQRYSSLDVKIISHELSKSLVSLRLANVYDLSTRIFLLKFAKPNHREQLIIESGFRCHLTSFSRATAAAPSNFVARLRKFLRTRRVTAVSQVGTDRIIEIQFSDGAYRLFLEFYAGGNIVLTDSELTILGLLRNVSEGAEHEQYKLGVKYDVSSTQNYAGVPELTHERLRTGLSKAIERQQEEAQKPGKRPKKRADALRIALAKTVTEFPPVLIDHTLSMTGFDRTLPPEEILQNEDLFRQVFQALQRAREVVDGITGAEVAKGYILAQRKSSRKGNSANTHDATVGLVYEDFHPFSPHHLAKDAEIEILEFEGFNKCVDEFFSSMEGQKLESRLQEREDQAKRKIEAAHQEQEKRIGALQQVQDLNMRKAEALQSNVERVKEATQAVNGLIRQGMDWDDIGKLIQNEQSRNNPVAQMIKLPLKLHENTITILLPEFSDDFDEEMADETDDELSDSDDDNDNDNGVALPSAKPADNRLAIDIDLALSPWANSTQYFDQKRSAADKEERTAQASQKALKSTEKKVMADLKKGLKQEKEVLRPVRRQMWFEKFIYFISSDGYLVLAGKDAQQNEILYRRYLKRGDVYVHADMHGAASVIIKNNPSTPDAPIPPSTLSQAGTLSVCTSNAWDSKAVMSAWWVTSDQVSKTAPTGEYLTTGGFMVRGKKNFLPPAQLLLGFAVMFQISEESKARHFKHRAKESSVPPTPELTDAETAADSSVAGGDGSTESDDEFPDAGPSGTVAEEDDSSMQTPMSSTNLTGQDEDDGDDEFPDVLPQNGQDSDDEEDEGPSFNPLQTNGVRILASSKDDVVPSGNSGNQSEEDHGESSSTTGDESATPRSATRPLSVKEKRIRRNRARQDALPNSDAESQNTANAKAPSQKHVRGKKGKAKKMATKYADQDEEDRAIALKLLGSKAAQNDGAGETSAKESVKETAEEARARRRAQHDKAQKEGLEAEEIRRLNLEEGVEALDAEEMAALSQLDAFVGTPLPGDEILEAIPICAPWQSLQKFKYKVKLQPGQQKKGKALREILGKWTKDAQDHKKVDSNSQDTEKIWPREADLIKAWREAEIIGIIPVKQMRVIMSGSAQGDKGKKGAGGKGGRGGKGSKKR